MVVDYYLSGRGGGGEGNYWGPETSVSGWIRERGNVMQCEGVNIMQVGDIEGALPEGKGHTHGDKASPRPSAVMGVGERGEGGRFVLKPLARPMILMRRTECEALNGAVAYHGRR